jgi:hypothetical protein
MDLCAIDGLVPRGSGTSSSSILLPRLLKRCDVSVVEQHFRMQSSGSPDVDQDLPCQELVELVTDYLEDRLPASQRARFDAHLAQCSGCRTYLEQMRQTVRALGRLTEESIEPAIKDRLLDAFRDWKRRSV